MCAGVNMSMRAPQTRTAVVLGLEQVRLRESLPRVDGASRELESSRFALWHMSQCTCSFAHGRSVAAHLRLVRRVLAESACLCQTARYYRSCIAAANSLRSFRTFLPFQRPANAPEADADGKNPQATPELFLVPPLLVVSALQERIYLFQLRPQTPAWTTVSLNGRTASSDGPEALRASN